MHNHTAWNIGSLFIIRQKSSLFQAAHPSSVRHRPLTPSIHCVPQLLFEAIVAKYMAEAIYRVPALLGSLGLLGNPTQLVQHFTLGLYDAVAEPLGPLLRGSLSGFVLGLGRGKLFHSLARINLSCSSCC